MHCLVQLCNKKLLVKENLHFTRWSEHALISLVVTAQPTQQLIVFDEYYIMHIIIQYYINQ